MHEQINQEKEDFKAKHWEWQHAILKPEEVRPFIQQKGVKLGDWAYEEINGGMIKVIYYVE